MPVWRPMRTRTAASCGHSTASSACWAAVAAATASAGESKAGVSDGADGYRWVGLTGTARPVTDQATAQADIAGMARRYHADDPDKAERIIANRFTQQERVSFRFRPDAVHDHLDE